MGKSAVISAKPSLKRMKYRHVFQAKSNAFDSMDEENPNTKPDDLNQMHPEGATGWSKYDMLHHYQKPIL